jgi:acetyltransferase-like isoleucine patch superfamily enzyme
MMARLGAESCCSIRIGSNGAKRCRCRSGAEADPVPLDEGEPLNLECRHFLDCIATGGKPRTDGREGLRILRVLARERGATRTSDAVPTRKVRQSSDVQIHESAFVDEPCEIGVGTSIWHFVHILPRKRIGRYCSLGQNVMAGPDVNIGDGCKIQNNVSIYKGVTLEDGFSVGPLVSSQTSTIYARRSNVRTSFGRRWSNVVPASGPTPRSSADTLSGNTLSLPRARW